MSLLEESFLPFLSVQSAWLDLEVEYSIEQQRQFKQLVRPVSILGRQM